MKNVRLEYDVTEDMLGRSKKIVVKYSDDQDIREPIFYIHYNEDILKAYANGKVKVNQKYEKAASCEIDSIKEYIKKIIEAGKNNDFIYCSLYASLLVLCANVIIKGVEKINNKGGNKNEKF